MLKLLLSISFALAYCSIGFAKTPDLLHIYLDAKQHDPTFKAAYADLLATQLDYPIAVAGLLPSIQTEAKLTQTDQLVTSPFPFNPSGPGHALSLNLTQSVFNLEKMKTVQQGKKSAKQAEVKFEAAKQALITRVTKAYLDVLEAMDNLRFTEAEKNAKKRHYDQAQQRYNVGLDPITSVHNAKAAYDLVVANAISAQNNVENKREVLRTITGQWYEKIKTLQKNVPLIPPNPSKVESWVETALKQNLEIVSTQIGAEIVKDNIHKSFAGHMPQVSAFASVDESLSQIQSGYNRQRAVTVGLKMNLSLIESGAVVFKTKQASYKYQKEQSQLDNVKLKAISETRQVYNGILAGISQIKAGQQAVKSARSSVNSTEEAVKAGIRTIVDLLDAQTDLYQAQRQLAATQYQYIQSTLKLKELTGLLNESDISTVNSWLQ